MEAEAGTAGTRAPEGKAAGAREGGVAQPRKKLPNPKPKRKTKGGGGRTECRTCGAGGPQRIDMVCVCHVGAQPMVMPRLQNAASFGGEEAFASDTADALLGKGEGGGCVGDSSREEGNTKSARSKGKESKAGKKAGGKLREKGSASEGCVDGQERHDWQRWHKFTPGKEVAHLHTRPVRGP